MGGVCSTSSDVKSLTNSHAKVMGRIKTSSPTVTQPSSRPATQKCLAATQKSVSLELFTYSIATMDRSRSFILELYFASASAAKQFYELLKKDCKEIVLDNKNVHIKRGAKDSAAYRKVLMAIGKAHPDCDPILNMIRNLSQKAQSDSDQKDNDAIITTVLKVTSQWCNKKRKKPEKDRFTFNLTEYDKNVFQRDERLCGLYNKLAVDTQQLQVANFLTRSSLPVRTTL